MTAPEKLFAFVLMPFEASFDDVYRLGIKAAVEDLGMIATRVDEQVFHKEGILAWIRISTAGLAWAGIWSGAGHPAPDQIYTGATF